jgi:oxygen-independent coproporphyrinogen-3 oxidase
MGGLQRARRFNKRWLTIPRRNRMTFGLYIHWPYCARICPYCDFNVYRARGVDEDAMTDALVREIAALRARLGPRRVDSIFFGGGTPSLMRPRQVARLIEAAHGFDVADTCEVSLEANPEDVQSLGDLTAAGVNRVSLGVQALQDGDLKSLGRAHDRAAALVAITRAAATGARVSIDLIYARPGQTLDAWRTELTEALALPIEHLSVYQLTIEQGTAFDRAARRGALITPGPDLAVDFYELTQDMCAAAGFEAYEISNHARGANARSRHNLIYWQSGEWAGIGPGAHGRVMLGGARTATRAAKLPDAYQKRVARDGVGWEEAIVLTPAEIAEEALMMGLRITEGVALPTVKSVLNLSRLAALRADGVLAYDEARLWLTPRGRLVADRIAADLVSAA